MEKKIWKAVEYAGYYVLQEHTFYGDKDLLNKADTPKAKINAELAALTPDLMLALSAALFLIDDAELQNEYPSEYEYLRELSHKITSIKKQKL